ncbi:MAG: flagellar biosynthesis anti-sigma factor FlgM [Gammaproteobacteria bacterium]|nr:MAG: flagellar biosynthesis anti-sigma factor FlgM [Gammaproteobacteria bacterium]
MSIEIDTSRNRPPLTSTETGRSSGLGEQPSDTAVTSHPSASRADSASITSRAAQLQRLEAQIENLPIVDTHRVDEVQRALATGSYEIQPARVADKLLRFEAGLDKPS